MDITYFLLPADEITTKTKKHHNSFLSIKMTKNDQKKKKIDLYSHAMALLLLYYTSVGTFSA